MAQSMRGRRSTNVVACDSHRVGPVGVRRAREDYLSAASRLGWHGGWDREAIAGSWLSRGWRVAREGALDAVWWREAAVEWAMSRLQGRPGLEDALQLVLSRVRLRRSLLPRRPSPRNRLVRPQVHVLTPYTVVGAGRGCCGIPVGTTQQYEYLTYITQLHVGQRVHVSGPIYVCT